METPKVSRQDVFDTPSCDDLYLQAQLEGLVFVLGKRRAEKLVLYMADRLATADDPRARRARAMFLKHLPTCLAMIRRQ